MPDAAERFAEELAEPARGGLLRALEIVPAHRRPVVSTSSDSPWVTIDQFPGPTLVVWKETGAVYECDVNGAVGEDPIA